MRGIRYIVNSVQANSAALVMFAPSYFIVMIVALFKVRLLLDALNNKNMASHLPSSLGAKNKSFGNQMTNVLY